MIKLLVPMTVFLVSGCAYEHERRDLELEHFVKAYQSRGLFDKRQDGWHSHAHDRAKPGCPFHYAGEPEKGVEIYEFVSAALSSIVEGDPRNLRMLNNNSGGRFTGILLTGPSLTHTSKMGE